MFSLVLVALVSTPDDLPCTAARQATALAAVRKVFPKAAVERPCHGNQLELQRLDLSVDGVELRVMPRALYDRSKWKVLPFAKADAPKKHVKQLRELKLFARLEARSRLECIAGSDAAGTTTWFRCSTAPWELTDTTPSNGRLDGKRDELEVAFSVAAQASSCSTMRVESFAIPGDLVALAPYWELVAAVPEVRTFREQHRSA
ncbi:MAG: hypothetical protein JNK82_07930, partial [Myxococcaceae bacterium]|nr:hypothetical protein [Myxococcaceae bacterium]